jgi:hypothetical protein
MQNLALGEIIAAGSVAANGTAVVARGFAPATTGNGVYTITLDRLCNVAECVVQVTPRTTGSVAPSVVHTTDTVKTVHLDLIGAIGAHTPTNCPFDIVVYRVSGGAGR